MVSWLALLVLASAAEPSSADEPAAPAQVVFLEPGRACLGETCLGTHATEALPGQALELLRTVDGSRRTLTSLEVVGITDRNWPTVKVRATPESSSKGFGSAELHLDLDPAQLIPQVDRTYRTNFSDDVWIELAPGVPWETPSTQRGTYCEDGVCASLAVPASHLALWAHPKRRTRPVAHLFAPQGLSESDPKMFAFHGDMVLTTRPGGSTVIATHGSSTYQPFSGVHPAPDRGRVTRPGIGFTVRREGRHALVRLQTRHMEVQGWVEATELESYIRVFSDGDGDGMAAGMAGGLGHYSAQGINLSGLHLLPEGVPLQDPSSGQVRGHITERSVVQIPDTDGQHSRVPFRTRWGVFDVAIERRNHTPPAAPYAARQRQQLGSVGRMEHVDAQGVCRAFTFEPDGQWQGRLLPDDPADRIHMIAWQTSSGMVAEGWVNMTIATITPEGVPVGGGDAIRRTACHKRPCPLEGAGWRVTSAPCSMSRAGDLDTTPRLPEEP